jgi:GxxExxY protein
MLLEHDLTEQIIGAAIEVHKELGPGLLESAYEQCFCHELNLQGLQFKRQVRMPVDYKGVKLTCGYTIDVIVENRVIIELKCVPKLLLVHKAQLLTYLRLSGKRVGLLVNFNVPLLRDGIERRVL